MAHELNAAPLWMRGTRGTPSGATAASARSSAMVGDDLRALRAVVEGTAAGTGQAFFRSLARHLADAIDVHYVAVSEFIAPPQGRMLAFWDRDRIKENGNFDYTTSPAGEDLHNDLVHYPTGLLERLPQATR